MLTDETCPRYFLGVGHERGAALADIEALVEAGLRQCHLSPADIALVASIDVKRQAGLITALGACFRVEVRFFSASVLEAETPRLQNPSEAVFRRMGCHGVAEAAALAGAGSQAKLILPKTSGQGVTCAIAQAG